MFRKYLKLNHDDWIDDDMKLDVNIIDSMCASITWMSIYCGQLQSSTHMPYSVVR